MKREGEARKEEFCEDMRGKENKRRDKEEGEFE